MGGGSQRNPAGGTDLCFAVGRQLRPELYANRTVSKRFGCHAVNWCGRVLNE